MPRRLRWAIIAAAMLSVVEAIRDHEWKLIREVLYDADTGARTKLEYQLYRIGEDPEEAHEVFFENRAVAERLEKQLRARWKDPFGLHGPSCPP